MFSIICNKPCSKNFSSVSCVICYTERIISITVWADLNVSESNKNDRIIEPFTLCCLIDKEVPDIYDYSR